MGAFNSIRPRVNKGEFQSAGLDGHAGGQPERRSCSLHLDEPLGVY